MLTNRHAIVFAIIALSVSGSAVAIQHSGPTWGTWEKGRFSHHVVGDVIVPAGETLIIEQGAVVVFEGGTSLRVEGELIAQAEWVDPIWFFAAGTEPWGGLVFTGAGPHDVRHVVLDGAATAVRVEDSAELHLSWAEIRNSLHDGAHFEANSSGSLRDSLLAENGRAGIRITGSSPTIEDCELESNVVPVVVSVDAFPAMARLSAIGHETHDGIELDTSQPWRASGTWTDAGIPYVVDAGRVLTVDTSANVQLDAGSVMKFGRSAQLEVRGVFAANGSATQRCVLTSFADDLAMGDTNSDQGASGPIRGDWRGVRVEPLGRADFLHSDLSYAEDGLFALSRGQANVIGCRVRNHLFRGLTFGIDSIGIVEGTSIHDNDIGLEIFDPTGVAVGRLAAATSTGGGNSFGCNTSYDVNNRSSTHLEAHHNFWDTVPPPASAVNGEVQNSGYLLSEPAAVAGQRVLRLARSLTDDLVLRWDMAGSCARYRVMAFEDPNGPRTWISSEVNAGQHVDTGGGRTGTTLTFYQVERQH